jgi:hypothetical protein
MHGLLYDAVNHKTVPLDLFPSQFSFPQSTCAANIMKLYFKNEKNPICIEILLQPWFLFLFAVWNILIYILILYTKCARKLFKCFKVRREPKKFENHYASCFLNFDPEDGVSKLLWNVGRNVTLTDFLLGKNNLCQKSGRDLKPRITMLTRASSNLTYRRTENRCNADCDRYERQACPLVRERAPHRQIPKCLTVK